jgi:hypothetical protein
MSDFEIGDEAFVVYGEAYRSITLEVTEIKNKNDTHYMTDRGVMLPYKSVMKKNKAIDYMISQLNNMREQDE